jgi:hypothetical protein
LSGEDQPFLLLVIDGGVASKLNHHEQQAATLATIQKIHRVPLWEAEGAQLWVSKVAVACTCLYTNLAKTGRIVILEATARLEIRIKHQNGIANNRPPRLVDACARPIT